MNDRKELMFYAEHLDANGHRHYGLNIYNRLTGILTYFSDYLFII